MTTRIQIHEDNPNAEHAIPLGAVVLYKAENITAKLVVVQHSRNLTDGADKNV